MLNHTAKILWLACCLGRVNALPPDAVKKLLGTRESLGIRGVNTLENRCGIDRKA